MVNIGDAVGDADNLSLPRLGDKLARVADNAHPNLIRQVQSRAVALQLVHHAKRLLVVPERLSRHIRQRRLARVAKRRVSQIVSIGRCLRQVLIEPQAAADCARNARDLKRMRHARAVMVALRREKHLRLMHQTAE